MKCWKFEDVSNLNLIQDSYFGVDIFLIQILDFVIRERGGVRKSTVSKSTQDEFEHF